MAKVSKNNATALEICDSHITVVQLHEGSHGPQLKLLRAATLPPRTVIDGEITDPDQLAENIFKLLMDAGIKGLPLFVGINNKAFVKRVDRLPEMPLEDLKSEIDIRVGSSPFLKGAAFQADYIKVPIQGLQIRANPPIFYAGIQRSRVETIRSLIETDGFQLAALELMPLAILRAMIWQKSPVEEYFMTLCIESNFLDFSIIHNQNILFTHTIRMDVATANDDSFKDFSDALIQKITLFLIAYSNTYPKERAITKVLFFTRLPIGETLPDILASHFSKIEFTRYNPRQNISFDSKFPNPDTNPEAKDQQLMAVPAIGLALKAFEEHQRGINLTKVKRSFGPIIYPNILKRYLLIGILVVTAIYGTSLGLSHTAKTYKNNIKLTQDELRSLQSGDYLRQQQTIRDIKTRIGFLDQITKSTGSTVTFFESMVEGLPNSVTLTHVQLDRANTVTLKGSAYLQEDIYTFYNHLQKSYASLSISGITSQRQDAIQSFLFEMKFTRN